MEREWEQRRSTTVDVKTEVQTAGDNCQGARYYVSEQRIRMYELRAGCVEQRTGTSTDGGQMKSEGGGP